MLKVNRILANKPQNAVYSVAPNQMVIEALELMAARNIGGSNGIRGWTSRWNFF